MVSRENAKPPAALKAAVYLLIISVLWYLWPPLGAIAIVFALGNLKLLAERNAPFWQPKHALLFGCVAGFVVACLVQASSRLALSSPYGAAAMAAFGFYPVAYIGYGVPRNPLLQDGWQQLQLLARRAAAIAYLIATGAALAWAFTHNWYSA